MTGVQTCALPIFHDMSKPEALTALASGKEAVCLHDKLWAVAYAASNDIDKKILCGVLIDPAYGVVSCDLRRLALRPYTFKEGCPKIVIPTEMLSVAEYAFMGKKPRYSGLNRISASKNFTEYCGTNITITCPNLEGVFPPWRKVIPQTTTLSFRLPQNIQEQTAPIIALMSGKCTGVTLIVSEDGSVKAEFDNPGVAHWEAVIKDAIRLDSNIQEEYRVSFDYRYLMGLQKAIGTAMILHLENVQSPAKVTNHKGELYGVVMPMDL